MDDNYYLSENYLTSSICPKYDENTRILDDKKLIKLILKTNHNCYNYKVKNSENVTIDDYVNFLTYIKKYNENEIQNDLMDRLKKHIYKLFINNMLLFINQLFNNLIIYKKKDNYIELILGTNECIKLKLYIINPFDKFKIEIDSLGYHNSCPKNIGKKYLNDIFQLVTNFLSIELKRDMTIELFDASYIKEIKINDTLYNDIYISLLKCSLLKKKDEYCVKLSSFLKLNFYKLIAQLFINNKQNINISSKPEPKMYQLMKDFYIKQKITNSNSVNDVLLYDYSDKRYMHELLFKTIIYKAFDTEEYRKLLYDNRHEVKVTLRTLNYLIYGESWYQREFKKILIDLKSNNNKLRGPNIDSFRNANIIDILGLYFTCKNNYSSINNKNRLLKKICKTSIIDIINNSNFNDKNIYILQLFSKYKDYSIKEFAKLFRNLSYEIKKGYNNSINQYNEVYLLFMIINNVFDDLFRNRNYIGIYKYNGTNIDYSQPLHSLSKANILRNVNVPYNQNNSYFIPH